MNDERLAEVRARLAAATPGPWYWRNTQEPYLFGFRSRVVMAFARMGMQGAQPQFRNAAGLLDDAGKANINAYPDAELIAHAPADIADLLAEVERLRAIADQFPCDGMCSPNEGPEETCSRHGRAPADLWQRIDRLIAENNRLRAVAETANAWWLASQEPIERDDQVRTFMEFDRALGEWRAGR